MRVISRVFENLVSTSVVLVLATGFMFPVLVLGKTVTPDDGRVVTIKAFELGKLMGEKIDSLSLQAVQDGRLLSIPSQIDEMTEEGYVYFKKGKYKNGGEDGVFDSFDELMFMIKDAGVRRTDKHFVDGKLLAEIETISSNGTKRYVYLVKDALITSDKVYVRYSVDSGRVETDHFSLQSRPDNAFVWEELIVESFTGPNKKQPYDTMKLRFGSSIAFVGPRLNFSNNSIVAHPVEDKTGAIRSVTQYKLQVKIAGVPFLSFDLQTFISEQGLRYVALMEIPRVRRTLVSRPAVFISLDGRDLQGAKIRVAGGPEEPAIVDGNISFVEEKIMQTEMSEENNWIWITTGYHSDNIALLKFSEFGKFPVTPFIQDDPEAENKPEFHPGQAPNVGYQLKGMALKGVQVIDVTLHFFDDSIVTKDINKFVGDFKQPTQVKVQYF